MDGIGRLEPRALARHDVENQLAMGDPRPLNA